MSVSPSSKVCPKCQPHLAATAGAVEQDISREPYFSRKKKSPEHNKRVTFITDYAACGSPTKENEKALRYKSGYRRTNTSHPSTYQTNYCWIDPSPFTSSLLLREDKNPREPTVPSAAQEQLISADNHPKNADEAPVKHVQYAEMASELKDDMEASRDPQLSQESKMARAGGSKRRPPVEPLNLPLSANTTKPPGPPLRTRNTATVNSKPRVKADTRSRSHAERDSRSHKRKSSSPEAGAAVRKKKKVYSSPVQRLYEDDHKHLDLARGRWQTQYRAHYKDWMGKVLAGRREKKENAPPTYGSHAVLTDSADPRLLKHLQQPSLPRPRPPTSHWKTNYETEFVEPTKFRYERGAWMPDVGNESAEGEREPREESPGSWFNQLVELRQKAEYYKWKSLHTNFDIEEYPDHLEENFEEQSHSSSTSVSTPPKQKSNMAHRKLPSQSTYHAPEQRSAASNYVAPVSSSASIYTIPGQSSVSNYHTAPGQSSASDYTEHGRTSHTSTNTFHTAPTHLHQDVKMHTQPPRPAPSHPLRPGLHQQSEPLVIEDIEDEDDFQSATDSLPLAESDENAISDKPAALLRDAQCTCADKLSDLGEVRGRVPIPVPRELSMAPKRHHLDLTTPHDDGILIPSSKSDSSSVLAFPRPSVSPKFRRDMKSTAPINPPSSHSSVEDVLVAYNNRLKADKDAVAAEGNSVPKSVPASSSPYHAHCVPENSHGTTNAGAKHSSHIRKLNFDIAPSAPSRSHAVPSAPNRAHAVPSAPQTAGQPARYSGGAKSAPRPLSHSCQTCGASLQPTVPPSATRTKLRSQGTGVGSTRPAEVIYRQRSPIQHHTGHAQTSHSRAPEARREKVAVGSRQKSVPVSQTHYSNSGGYREGYGSSYQFATGLSSNKGPLNASGKPSGVSNGPGASSPGLRASHQSHDIDEVSLSSMSLSSCSVASEILAKAKKRRHYLRSSHTQYRPHE